MYIQLSWSVLYNNILLQTVVTRAVPFCNDSVINHTLCIDYLSCTVKLFKFHLSFTRQPRSRQLVFLDTLRLVLSSKSLARYSLRFESVHVSCKLVQAVSSLITPWAVISPRGRAVTKVLAPLKKYM